MFDRSIERVAALLSPKNIVILGASDRPGSWGWRTWRNLRANHYPHMVYPINPNRSEVWGVPCYRHLSELPEPPDHLAIYLPAALVPEALASGAKAGARSATIFSAGFGEGDAGEGRDIRDKLLDVIKETGIAVSGPNCVGNYNAASRCVTLVEDRSHDLSRGTVALVGQSGGAIMFLKRCLEERGMIVDAVVTSGNEVDLTTADYIAYFASQPNLKAIILYLEHVADCDRLKAAAEFAAASGKTVIAYKIGRSEAGRSAALAHTGALAGRVEAFDAAFLPRGIVRVESLDEAVEIAELATRDAMPKGARVGAITISGAFRGMLMDTAERCGVEFPKLDKDRMARLVEVLGGWSSGDNPIDGGAGIFSNPDNLAECVRVLHDDPGIDMIVIQGAVPNQAGNARAEKYIAICRDYAQSKDAKPLAFVSFASHGMNAFAREMRDAAPKVAFLHEIGKALSCIGKLGKAAKMRALHLAAVQAQGAIGARRADQDAVSKLLSGGDGRLLNEPDSQALLAAYGIASPLSCIVASKDEAVRKAVDIGFPVVLKFVSSAVAHKSDIGGVHLNLRDAEQVGAAYEKILSVIERHDIKPEGILVSQFVTGGVELALGFHRDAEAGLVLMVAQGGVNLEIIKDVQLRSLPISRPIALDMLNGLRGRQLLYGYRGAPVADLDSVCDAIMRLSALAADYGDAIESIDINPIVASPKGCLALDAVVVLSGPQG